MDAPSHILENGTRIRTHHILDSSEGIHVGASVSYLHARRGNTFGTIDGVLPGHGGDIYWVRHDDRSVALYCWSEFELEAKRAKPQKAKPLGHRGDKWLVHRKTGSRLYVPRRQHNYFTEFDARMKSKPMGRQADMVMGVPEGRKLFPLWFHKDDLSLLYKPLRVPAEKPDFPGWLERMLEGDGVKDLLLADGDESVVVAVQDVHAGWVCLSSILQEETVNIRVRNQAVTGVSASEYTVDFDWSLQRYNTFFLRVADAVPLLKPRWGPIPLTVHDRVVAALDAPDPVPDPAKPMASSSTGRLQMLGEDL